VFTANKQISHLIDSKEVFKIYNFLIEDKALTLEIIDVCQSHGIQVPIDRAFQKSQTS